MADARRVLAVAAMLAMAPALGGCLEDVDCGICNENSLELQILSGTNYTGELVHIVSPTCSGPECPEPFTEARRFVETIGLCEETDLAQNAPRGPHEYCKIAPIVVASGLQFVFNNLLEPTTIELIRKRPDVPNLFETYDWKTQVVKVSGPLSRFAGDWRTEGGTDVVSRFVNLSCVDNLRAAGVAYGADDYADPATNPCNQLSGGVPLKLQAEKAMAATRGKWDDRAIGESAEYDCETPVDGLDTCCSQCDFSLSVMVDKYGAGERIACDPQGDRLIDCAGFVVSERRDDEPEGYVPPEDLLRGVHPSQRDQERATVACVSEDGCRDPSGPGLAGAECVGVDSEGRACSPDAGDPTCTAGVCRVPWFVDCRVEPDTTGDVGYCVDARFDSDGAGACHATTTGDRLIECDANADGHLTAAECCPEGTSCDPVVDLADFAPLSRYERKTSLPSRTRELGCDGGCGDDCGLCTDSGGCSSADCTDEQIDACAEEILVEQTCSADEDESDYAVNLVAKLGGVIYDGAIKGFEWRPADRGGRPRAVIEACAERRGLIAPRNVSDGWRAHDVDGLGVEIEAEWDLALCSGQRYEAVFQASDEGEHVVDKKNNTLDGKLVYAFETPQFHIVPSSGFPGDNLRIGACDTFSLDFSNKFDLSPENLTKIEIHDLSLAAGERTVAGGPQCAATRQIQTDTGAPPCLAVDVADQASGEIHFRVDPVAFDPVLVEGRTYAVYVPGILDPQASDGEVLTPAAYAAAVALDGIDPAVYAAAFWDACGMPLFVDTVLDENGGLLEQYEYTFTVDPVRCAEDGDADGVALSCDNAPDAYNPLQSDIDGDGTGDALDYCAASPEISRDSSDSDRDGIGNGCDRCPDTTSRYNELAADNALPSYLWIRNAGAQADGDGDGVGDVCDNCPGTANCGEYDPLRPWRLGDPIDREAATCQRDADFDMVGDACAGSMSDLAAGPVGLGDLDDFDQDGLTNIDDACPRHAAPGYQACDADAVCGEGRRCTFAAAGAMGVCNHLDADVDGVGDACDSCPAVANAIQVLDGGAQQDDPDGDFVGSDCELGDGCSDDGGPRPLGFFDVSSAGMCCTTLLVDDGGVLRERWGVQRLLVDADGLPISLECSGADCRELPQALAETPGVLTLPAGCEGALTEAGTAVETHEPLSVADLQGDLDALWNLQCRLPVLDQDYDGLADQCDLCPFSFDPTNEIYIDQEGRTWPNDGAVCSGDNSLAARCDQDQDSGDDAGTDSGDDGGSDTGAGTGDESSSGG